MLEVGELYRRWEVAPETRKCMALLPLLEHEFTHGAESILESTPLSQHHLELLIEYALDWEIAASWPELALEWIEAGFPINRSICEVLFRKAKKGSKFSQNQRHRSMKIATNWERENET